ncbi:MAG: hypothetical protein ACTHKY_17040 [Ginsengibacter sp.]
MLLFLLRAGRSISDAFIEGVFKALILGSFLLLCSTIYKSFSKKRKVVNDNNNDSPPIDQETENAYNISNQKNPTSDINQNKEPLEIRFYNYFFLELNKGYRRLLFVGSILFPLLFGFYLHSSAVQEGDDYPLIIAIIIGLITGCLFYWILFCLIMWIIKGFKEDKRNK